MDGEVHPEESDRPRWTHCMFWTLKNKFESAGGLMPRGALYRVVNLVACAPMPNLPFLNFYFYFFVNWSDFQNGPLLFSNDIIAHT